MKHSGVVQVRTGSDVFELLERDEFMSQWRQLYERCPWATAAQHPEFARAWYRVYRDRVFPVLVYAEGDGELLGLLGLYRKDGWLEHAGRGYCEYNVWTALPEHGDAFMPRAIAALDRRLGPTPLVFGFMPPDTPLGWLSGTSPAAARAQLGHSTRRVLRVSDPALVRAYLKGKSRLRTSRNKLERTGKVRFRRVTDLEDMKRVLLEFEWMIEFRKGAMFDSLPFRDEPLRRECLLAQAAVPGLLHVTVLERDDRILAAHVATCGRRELSIAGIVHSEFEARHSPGSHLILELIPLLCQEGIELLDFTPGDDEYKARFASETEPVYPLTVYATHLAREAERARWLGISVLRSVRNRLPEPVRQKLQALRRSSRSPSREGAPATSHVEFHELGPDFGVAESGLREAPGAPPRSAADGAGPVHVARTGPLTASALALDASGLEDAWAHNTIAHLVRYRGDRTAYVNLLRRAHAYVRAGARMYTRASSGRLEAACFVLPTSAFAPELGLPAGEVVCDLERWGDGPERERWLRELAPLIRSEGALFLALPTGTAPRASGGAPRSGRGRTPLELLPGRAPSPESQRAGSPAAIAGD